MANRKKVSVQYRSAGDPSGLLGDRSLEQMLSDAMLAAPEGLQIGTSSALRHCESEEYGTLVLNHYRRENFGFFGELVRFEPGADLTLLEMNAATGEYKLKQAKAPEGHEPLKGLIYFLAVGNHLVLVEQDLTAWRAERYVSWLLGERTGLVDSGGKLIVTLDATFEREASRRLGKVKTITLTPPSIEAGEAAAAQMLRLGGAIGSPDHEGPGSERTLALLYAVGVDPSSIDELTRTSTSIDVTVQLRFKEGHRVKAVEGPRIGRLLRHIPEEELVLDGPEGREKHGQLVKLSYAGTVEVAGSLLVRSEVARLLFEAYTYFRKEGHVGP